MFQMRFMDGTPVPDEYAQKVSSLVSSAATVIESVGEDGLEEYTANRQAGLVAVYCRWHGPNIGWQAVRVLPALGALPPRKVNNLLRITTRLKVRGGWFVDPKKLALH